MTTLTILRDAPRRGDEAMVVALCSCGREFVTYRKTVRRGLVRSCGCMTVALRKAANEATPVSRPIPLQSVFVPPVRLLGRAVIALTHGPMTAHELARRCGVGLDELEAVVLQLRSDAEALRIGDELLVFGRWESASAVFEARAKLLARVEEVRHAA